MFGEYNMPEKSCEKLGRQLMIIFTINLYYHYLIDKSFSL